LASLDRDDLKKILLAMDFSVERFFLCLRDDYRQIVMDFIKERDLNTLWDDGTNMVYMKHEDAIQLQYTVPEGLEIRSLSVDNTDKINSVWPHASPGSEKFIAYCIENNVNVGLYDKNTNELLAWCLAHDFTSLLALQVDENHYRKGYGEIIVRAITKKIAQTLNIDVMTNIVHANFKSMSLFEKLNFTKIDKNWWICVDVKK
jgi:ribosomal protein S18 acetylase RimI-like enzyme